jgi:hypothetical protein
MCPLLLDKGDGRHGHKALAGWARVRIWGVGYLAPPLGCLRPSHPPPGRHPRCLVEGARCTPLRYKKGVPWRRGKIHNIPTSLSCSPLLLGAPPSPPLSLFSLSRGLPKGYVGARQHHRCTLSCLGVLGSCPKLSTSAISPGSGIPGVNRLEGSQHFLKFEIFNSFIFD